MKLRFHKSSLAAFTLALTAGLFLAASTAQAVTYYWDNDGTTAGFGTAGGTWTAPTVSQWSTDATGVATPEASITTLTTDALNFGTATDGLATGTVTVSGTVDANTLTFDSASGAVLLSGGTINLAGTTPTITVNNAAATISSVITGVFGNAGLTKSGTGVLTLSGVNTYSGVTGINAGKISFTDSSAFGTSSSISVRNTSFLEFGANGLNLARNVQIQNSIGTTKTMQLDLAGTNTGTLSGQLQINLVTAGAFVINTGADDTLTVSGLVYGTGAAGITKTGAGTLSLSGANSYTAATSIAAGTLVADRADVAATSGALGNGGDIKFTGGTLQYTANSAGSDYSARIKSSTSAMNFDTNGQTVTFGTALANTNSGGLTKSGAGTLKINIGSAYTGNTVINAGTLQIDNTAGSTGWIPGAIAINNGSILEFTGSQQTILQGAGDSVTFGSGGGGSILLTKNVIWRTGAAIVTTGGSKNTVSGQHFNLQNSHSVTFDAAVGTDPIALEVSSDIRSGDIIKNGLGILWRIQVASAIGKVGNGPGAV